MELKEKLKLILNDAPKSREILCANLGCTDSQLRAAVRELRDDGVYICSNNKTRGYWLGSKDDAIRTARELRSKAFTLLREASRLDGKELDGQVQIEEEEAPGLLLNEQLDGQLTINF